METTHITFLISLGYCVLLIALSGSLAFFTMFSSNKNFKWTVWASEKLSIAFIIGIILSIITGFIHLITYIVVNNFNHG
jgi:hypothetical protein